MQRIAFATGTTGTGRGYGHRERYDEWSSCGGCRRGCRSAVAGAQNWQGSSVSSGGRLSPSGGARPRSVAPADDVTHGRGEGASRGSRSRVGTSSEAERDTQRKCTNIDGGASGTSACPAVGLTGD